MDDTPNLGLPYIMAAQSQKHVTHNEAIRALDAMVQLAVLDRDLSAPPVSPAEGARYIVGSSPTGAWSGHAGKVAAYQDGAWMLYAPVEGWIAWIADEDVAVVWDGATWSALTTGGGGGSGSFTTLAINGATADTTNRLSLNAPATLLNHDGDGHQLKINKASASDTASLLYQDAFSGRAELGLAGDDDFHFKVSPDGASWKEAIVIDRSTGIVAFPFTSLAGGRQVLAADLDLYVRADGSDGGGHTGLANTSGDAFLTLQKAVDVAVGYDLSIYKITIHVGAGTTYAGVILKSYIGVGPIIIEGDTTTPANVTINAPVTTGEALKAPACISTNGIRGKWRVRGLKFVSSRSGIYARGGMVEFDLCDFGACSNYHMVASNGGQVVALGNYAISGNASYHWLASDFGYLEVIGATVTLTGTPAFGGAFAFSTRKAGMNVYSNTYSGSATGARFLVSNVSLLFVNGAGASALPGNAAGTADAATYGGYV